MASDSMSQLANLMKGMTSTAPTASPSAVTKGGRRRKRKSTTKGVTKKTRKGRRHRRVKKSRVNWFF
jgi:hypothetical protein